MNISKRLISMRIVVLVVTIILALNFHFEPAAGQEKKTDIVDDSWSIARARRATPLELKQDQQYTSVNFLKLDETRIILTMRGEVPQKDLLYILADLCELGNRVFVSDAVILLASEKATDFADKNHRYRVFNQENVDFAKCMLPGMRATLVQSYEKAAVWESTRRVLFFLNRWAEFFGTYKKQIPRATTFLNVSLPFQVAEIRQAIKKAKLEELETLVTFFDHSKPLALFGLGEPLVGLDKDTLLEYLATLIDVRGKLTAAYPEHQKKLLREKEL